MKCLKKLCIVTVVVAITAAVCSIVIAGLDYIYQGILYSHYLEKAINSHQSTEYALSLKEKGVLIGGFFDIAFETFVVFLVIAVITNIVYLIFKRTKGKKTQGETGDGSLS